MIIESRPILILSGCVVCAEISQTTPATVEAWTRFGTSTRPLRWWPLCDDCLTAITESAEDLAGDERKGE